LTGDGVFARHTPLVLKVDRVTEAAVGKLGSGVSLSEPVTAADGSLRAALIGTGLPDNALDCGIDHVVVLETNDGGRSVLGPVAGSAAARALLNRPTATPCSTPTSIAMIMSLFNRTRCWKLALGEPLSTADLITTHLRH
jgi:hypothetical protein